MENKVSNRFSSTRFLKNNGINPTHEEGLRNDEIAAYKKTNASPALKKKEIKLTFLCTIFPTLYFFENPFLTIIITYLTTIVPPELGRR